MAGREHEVETQFLCSLPQLLSRESPDPKIVKMQDGKSQTMRRYWLTNASLEKIKWIILMQMVKKRANLLILFPSQ